MEVANDVFALCKEVRNARRHENSTGGKEGRRGVFSCSSGGFTEQDLKRNQGIQMTASVAAHIWEDLSEGIGFNKVADQVCI